jgi:hypothetical protein
MMVCSSDYEIRHPQDFVRARQDQQAVAWTRPTTVDSFVSMGIAVVGIAVVGITRVGISALDTVPPGTFTIV